MIIDWSNYRQYFKKIEKPDTDMLTYQLIPKKMNIEQQVTDILGLQIEKTENRSDETPKSSLKNVTLLIENTKL
jgi:hypothetical protein